MERILRRQRSLIVYVCVEKFWKERGPNGWSCTQAPGFHSCIRVYNEIVCALVLWLLWLSKFSGEKVFETCMKLKKCTRVLLSSACALLYVWTVVILLESYMDFVSISTLVFFTSLAVTENQDITERMKFTFSPYLTQMRQFHVLREHAWILTFWTYLVRSDIWFSWIFFSFSRRLSWRMAAVFRSSMKVFVLFECFSLNRRSFSARDLRDLSLLISLATSTEARACAAFISRFSLQR